MRVLPPDERVDQRAIARALALAEAAAPFSSPNPTVGCVLIRDGVVLGEGAHRYEAKDHAEIVALKAATAAGHSVHGATACVTLEPCSHHGRTGPCADALIAAGIGYCVVATVDPNPLVRGGGLAKLQAAGVEVQLLDPTSVEARRARRLNDAFAYSIQHGRPFVTLKAAVSRDGKLAPPESRRAAKATFWLTGQAAREDVHRLRHESDALLTGIGTVLADDPELTDRTGLPRRKPLLRVVLDSDLRTPTNCRLLQTAQQDVLLLASENAPQHRERALRECGAEVIRLPSAELGLDLEVVMATLAAASVRSVLVESGSILNQALLEHGMVDRLIVYEAPVALGEDALPFARDLSLPVVLARLTEVTEHRFPNRDSEDVCTTGYLHDPWSDVAL